MANQDAKQDRNRFPALIAHTGTAGTAEVVKLVATSDGAMTVDMVLGDLVNVQDQPYEVRVDDAASGTTFVGEADIPGTTSDATWRIKRIIDNNGTVDIQWADGDSNFNNIWDAIGTMVFD